MAGSQRASPGPSVDELRHDGLLHDLEMGVAESVVSNYFNAVFPNFSLSHHLKRSDKVPMTRELIPCGHAASNLRVSTPVPDLSYGYSRHGLTSGSQMQLLSMTKIVTSNSEDLLLPFLVVEYTSEGFGGSGGTLWMATNQCLGASATCVNMMEKLNLSSEYCRNSQVEQLDSTTFSIAMSGTEARLYISWKHDKLAYYQQKVKGFLLQDPEQFVDFRKHVLDIIDWGREERLSGFQRVLDGLLDAARQMSSTTMKSRPSPGDSSGNKPKRPKPSPLSPCCDDYKLHANTCGNDCKYCSKAS